MKLKVVTLNAGGLQSPGRFAHFCAAAARWARRGDAHVICIQEHNLDPAKAQEHERLARAKEFVLVIAHAPPAPDGVHRGGTLIMSLESTTTLKAEVCKDASGGLVRAQYEWMGRVYDIASVYAPAKAPKRVDFLSHVHQRLSDHTIACGDWNCVPDVTLDVKSSNPLNYPNAGATLLADVMARFNLHDYRREQLETDFEPTRSGTNSQGAPRAV